MIDFILILIVLAIGLYWSDGMKTREFAFHTVERYCHKNEVVLLDGYVALNGQWLKRDDQGKLKIWRSYLFEFSSTGEERYQGKITLLGLRVTEITLEPYRI